MDACDEVPNDLTCAPLLSLANRRRVMLPTLMCLSFSYLRQTEEHRTATKTVAKTLTRLEFHREAMVSAFGSRQFAVGKLCDKHAFVWLVSGITPLPRDILSLSSHKRTPELGGAMLTFHAVKGGTD